MIIMYFTTLQNLRARIKGKELRYPCIFHVTFYNQYSATVVSPETSGA